MPGSRSACRGERLRRAGSRASSSASWFRIAVAVARSRNRRSLQSIGRCSNCRIGPVGEQAVQILRLEPDRRQRHARLDAPLQLEQLDLQIGGGRQVRLILLQPPQLGDLAGLRAGGGGWRDRRVAHARDFSRAGLTERREMRAS